MERTGKDTYTVATDDNTGRVVIVTNSAKVIDAKGRDTQASINKRKQVLARYGVEVRLWPAS